MADNSKEQKKTNSPASNPLQSFIHPWLQDLGKSMVQQMMPATTVQNLVGTWQHDLGKSMVERMMPASVAQSFIQPWFQDLGKSMVERMMPATTVQNLVGTWQHDLGKSMVERMMPVNAFEGLHKSLVPSQRLYEGVMGQLIPSAVTDSQAESEANLSPSQAEIVQTLSARYLQDLTPDTETLADDLESIDEEELQELFQGTEEAWSDPVHTKFIKTAAGAGSWLEEEFPKLQQKTSRVLSELIARFLNEFIPALNLHLGTTYGIPGLMVASTISAAVGLITDKEKQAINREILLDRPCSYCEAKPGEQCVTVSGKNPGTKTAIHKDRWQ